MTSKPVNLTAALASFEEVYSPRIVARMNDYDVRVAHARGEHVWHVHDDTDEFFLVLDGRFDVATRDADGRETRHRTPSGRYVRRPERHRAQAVLAGKLSSDVRADRHVEHWKPVRGRHSRPCR